MLLLLWVLLLLLVLLPLVGNFGPLQLHVSKTFKTFRASRSLTKTGFFLGHVGTFLALFFESFFSIVFDRFFVDLGGVLEAKMGPKIDFWSDFLDVFLEPSFLRVFLTFFHVF